MLGHKIPIFSDDFIQCPKTILSPDEPGPHGCHLGINAKKRKVDEEKGET